MKVKLIITNAVGVVLAFLASWALGVFESTSTQDVFKHISDGTLITGGVMACMGLLTFCGNKGAFRMLGYGMKSFFLLFQPNDKKLTTERESYVDYNKRKEESPKSFTHLLIVGGELILIAIITFIVYKVI